MISSLTNTKSKVLMEPIFVLTVEKKAPER